MKTRRQKVICVLVGIFLLASFFVVPVSAAGIADGIVSGADSLNNQAVRFQLDQSGIDSDFVCGFGTDVDQLLHTFYTHSFDDLKSQYNNFNNRINVSEGEYDYPYYSFDSDATYPVIPSSGDVYGVFTLAFTGSIRTNVQSQLFNGEFVSLILTGGNMRYFTRNLEVYGIRFSVRPCSITGTGIGAVTHVTPTTTAGWSNTPNVVGDNAVYDYRKFIQSQYIMNSSIGGVLPLPNTYVFCVDIIVKGVKVNNQQPTDYGFGFDVDTFFSGSMLFERQTVIVGDSIAGLTLEALLQLPLYQMPDMSFIDDTLELQGSVLGRFDSAVPALRDLVSNFKTSLTSLSSGVESVSALIEYFISRTPILSAVVTFGLLLGLIAFILGFSSSLTQAGSNSHSSRFGNSSKPDYSQSNKMIVSNKRKGDDEG